MSERLLHPTVEAVLAGATELPRFLPMMMTAAGTIRPAEQPFARVRAGGGPRHFALSPDQRHAYAINAGDKVDLTTTLVMRRMPSVSPYPHWHYFDAYPPGNLRAVYRGNGIPMPWGNMTMISDPCQHWAVFRMLHTRSTAPSAQLSVLRSGDDKRLYCCESIRSKDAAGNPHVLCAGIDLAPALKAQGLDPMDTIEAIEKSCNRSGGSGEIPADARRQLESIGKILNIGWIGEGAAKDATIICRRSSNCPRDKHCLGKARPTAKPQIEEILETVIAQCAD